MPELMNLTLTVTVPRNGSQGVAFGILSEALQTSITDIPDLVSGNIAIFGDDFLNEEAETKSAEGDVHIAVADADAAADALRDIRWGTPRPWNEMTFEEQERVRKGELL